MIPTKQSKADVKHVLLTDRDVQLLALLYDHSMMSLGQVERYAFTGKAWPTILNRMKRLENAGFLNRIKVARLRHLIEKKNVGVVLQITPRGIAEIAKHWPEKTFLEAPPDIRVAQLEHDLLLVDVVEQLKKEIPAAEFMDGRRFIKGKSDIHRVPDAVMLLPGNTYGTAIELELTTKSEKRYRQIILSYRLTKQFNKVLFITHLGGTTRKIQAEILGYRVQSNMNIDTGKFSFRNLQELFQEKQSAA